MTFFTEQLAKGLVGVLPPGGETFRVHADAKSTGFLKAVCQAVEKKRRVAFILPTCRSELPLYAAFTSAYTHVSAVHDNRVTVLVTHQKDSFDLAAASYAGVRTGFQKQQGLLVVGKLSRSGKGLANLAKAARQKFLPVRLVITDQWTQQEVDSLEAAGLKPAAVIHDLRTVDYPEEPPRLSAIPDVVLAATRWQIPRSHQVVDWKPAKPTPEGKGLLVNPEVKLKGIKAHPVEDVAQEAAQALRRVPTIGMAGRFREAGDYLVRVLTSLPVHSHEVARSYVAAVGSYGYVVSDLMATMQACLHASDEASAKNAMIEAFLAFREATETLALVSQKRDRVLELAKRDSLFITQSRALRHGLENVLDQVLPGHGCSVVTWNDPVTWSPHDGPVVMTCIPPRHREWVLNQVPGREVHFVFTPYEADVLFSRMARRGLTDGPAVKLLTGIRDWKPRKVEAPRVNTPEEVQRLMDSIPATRAAIEAKAQGTARVRGLLLRGGGVHYVRDTAKLDVLRGSRSLKVKPADLEAGELVLLPKDSLDEDLQEAIFRAAEAKPQNQPTVQAVHAWKARVRQYAEEHGWGAADLAASLEAQRCPGINTAKVEAIFGLDGKHITQIANDDWKRLITATGRVIGDEDLRLHPEHLADCISRMRGMHMNAGRAVRRVVALSFTTNPKDLDAVADDNLGVSIRELQVLMAPAFVDAVTEPFTASTAVIGVRTESTEETQ